MKAVVSVSLGSSRRDFREEVEISGQRFVIERRGCDGDIARAQKVISDLDGHVAAIGLGGVNLAYRAGQRHYPCPDGIRLARSARITPVVDGSLFKGTYEAEVPRKLVKKGFTFAGKRVLAVSVLDRWGLAVGLEREGASVLVGDAVMALGMPVLFAGLRSFALAAKFTMWALRCLPVSWMYPLGARQHRRGKGRRWAFRGVEYVAGDYHFIRRYMPDQLPGVWIVTSTTLEQDRLDLKNAGVRGVVTMIPPIGGRTLGANVLDALAVAVMNRYPLTNDEAVQVWNHIGIEPHIEDFSHD